MRNKRSLKTKGLLVVLCGGLLPAIEGTCLPKNYLYNAAAEARSGLLEGVSEYMAGALNDAVFGDDVPGETPNLDDIPATSA